MSSMVATVPSAKKIQAKRRNAQRFTGPRAQAGKNIVSSSTSIQHGAAAPAAELDTRSDIFPLGRIAYELLTGSRP